MPGPVRGDPRGCFEKCGLTWCARPSGAVGRSSAAHVRLSAGACARPWDGRRERRTAQARGGGLAAAHTKGGLGAARRVTRARPRDRALGRVAWAAGDSDRPAAAYSSVSHPARWWS
eukprot:scaffold3505_cov385-Prasinococcus_capsulatus_cf.AAC.3